MEELHQLGRHLILSAEPSNNPDTSTCTAKSVRVVTLLPREVFNSEIDELIIIDFQVIFLVGASQFRLTVRDYVLAELLRT